MRSMSAARSATARSAAPRARRAAASRVPSSAVLAWSTCALLLQLLERDPEIAEHALLPEGQRGHRPGRAGEPTQVASREQQPEIAAASALVGFHELHLQVGQAAQPLVLEQLEPAARRVEILSCGRQLALGFLGFGDEDVALDFQLADIADERLGLTGQTIGFLPQARAVDRRPGFARGRRRTPAAARAGARRRRREDERDEAGGNAAAYGGQTS